MSSHRSFMSGAHGCTGNCTDPVAFEDELYYAELERQVLQLTADDNEGGEPKPFRRASYAPTSEASSVAVADFSVASRVASSWQIKRNGTGVFIPHAIKSRTRNSPAGRMVSDGRRRMYKLRTAKYEDQGSCRYSTDTHIFYH